MRRRARKKNTNPSDLFCFVRRVREREERSLSHSQEGRNASTGARVRTVAEFVAAIVRGVCVCVASERAAANFQMQLK